MADEGKVPLDPSDGGSSARLAKEFRNTVQGEMVVAAYCRKLKRIADQLADVNDPVSDKELTMRLIGGLDGRFKEQQELLESMVPFPSFAQAKSRLQIAEIKLESKPGAAGEEFRLQPRAQAEESAPKRKKVPTAGLDGCAPKRRGEATLLEGDDQAGRLARELRNTVQGDLTVEAYCSKLKGIADQLADADDPVSDEKLTMRLIGGLHGRFKEQQELLQSMVPFPSFMEAQSRLQIAEIKLQSKTDPQIRLGRRRRYAVMSYV